MREVRIGCSGWNYKSWRGTFYPRDLPTTKWLGFYASHLDTVEVNNSFYRLPEESTFAAWRQQVPDHFLVSVKASRFLTHMKRLRNPDEPLARFFSRAAALGPALGPVLYQLPGNFVADLGRLDTFLRELPLAIGGRPVRHVMEFRHPSWYTADTFRRLDARGVALCLHDMAGSQITEPFVGPFVYVRFHGTNGRYQGSYPAAQLTRWARRLDEQAEHGRPVFAYFNNDPNAVAVANAITLRTAMSSGMQDDC